jgi:hypothetical protein
MCDRRPLRQIGDDTLRFSGRMVEPFLTQSET